MTVSNWVHVIVIYGNLPVDAAFDTIVEEEKYEDAANILSARSFLSEYLDVDFSSKDNIVISNIILGESEVKKIVERRKKHIINELLPFVSNKKTK
jgi:hypothetical protein